MSQIKQANEKPVFALNQPIRKPYIAMNKSTPAMMSQNHSQPIKWLESEADHAKFNGLPLL